MSLPIKKSDEPASEMHARLRRLVASVEDPKGLSEPSPDQQNFYLRRCSHQSLLLMIAFKPLN